MALNTKPTTAAARARLPRTVEVTYDPNLRTLWVTVNGKAWYIVEDIDQCFINGTGDFPSIRCPACRKHASYQLPSLSKASENYEEGTETDAA